MTITQGLLFLAAAYAGLCLIDWLDARRRTCAVCCRRGALYQGNPRDPKDYRCRAHRVRAVTR